MTVRVILGRIVGRSRRRNPRPEELGAVTAEFAVALPAVTAVLALCLGGSLHRRGPGKAGRIGPSGGPRRRPGRLGSRDSCGRRTHRPGAERAGERGERGAW